MKERISLVLILALVLSLAISASALEAKVNFPTKPITVICP